MPKGNRRFTSRRVGAAKASTLASASTAESPGSAGRAGKYNAKGRKVEVDGRLQWCASDVEATRLEQLLELRAAGEIADLDCQPKFDLVVNNRRICGFRPDFRYNVVDELGTVLRTQIEEIKGVQHDDYIIRLNLFRALFPELPIAVIKPGQKNGSRSEWLKLHWSGRLANGNL